MDMKCSQQVFGDSYMLDERVNFSIVVYYKSSFEFLEDHG